MNNGCDCGRRRLSMHQGCRHAGLEVRSKERNCEQCGALFFRKQRGHGTDVARYCSRKCSDAALREAGAVQRALRAETNRLSRLRPCAECGSPFVARTNAIVCCSAKCRRLLTNRISARKYAKLRAKLPPTAVCKECGAAFERRRVKYDQNRYCGVRCQRAVKARIDARYAKKRGGMGTHRQRARFYGVAFDASITKSGVFRLAGFRCQICEVSTPQQLQGTHDDRAPEIDHIVPMSEGGGHIWSNVQCACRKCNNEKGSRLPTAEEQTLWASRVVCRPISPANLLEIFDPTTGPVSDFFVCTSSREISAQIR